MALAQARPQDFRTVFCGQRRSADCASLLAESAKPGCTRWFSGPVGRLLSPAIECASDLEAARKGGKVGACAPAPQAWLGRRDDYAPTVHSGSRARFTVGNGSGWALDRRRGP